MPLLCSPVVSFECKASFYTENKMSKNEHFFNNWIEWCISWIFAVSETVVVKQNFVKVIQNQYIWQLFA